MDEHAADLNELFIGKFVEWTSQSSGVTKTKHGRILSFIPATTNARAHLPRSVAKSRFVCGNKSQHDRYMVEVARRGKKSLFYAPRAKVCRAILDKSENS